MFNSSSIVALPASRQDSKGETLEREVAIRLGITTKHHNMAYVEVYVEMDGFSDEEVICEFEHRLLNKVKREKFEKALRKAGFVLLNEVNRDFDVSSPIDELKRDLVVEAFKTYTLDELEERLK